jgi:Leucine-rich repeat (LRR) protein
MNRIVQKACVVVLGLTVIQLYAVRPEPAIIKFETNDGQIFELPREVVLQAETLSELMEDVGLMRAETIALPETIGDRPGSLISKRTFEQVVQIMRAFEANKNLKGKALLDAVGKNVSFLASGLLVPDYFSLLYAFNYLNFKPGLQLVARTMAVNPALREYAQKEFARIDKDTREGFLKEIARYYFLAWGQDLPGVNRDTYGFSVREYLDYQPALIERAKMTGKLAEVIPTGGVRESQVPKLVLSKGRINNLDGLQDLVGIDTIQILDLRENQITESSLSILNDLANLRAIYLADNRIRELKHGIFNHLINLQTLFLTNNQLTEDSLAGLANLPKLRMLELSGNQIKVLLPNNFKGLSGLTSLYISHNQMREIRTGAFKELSVLSRLDLGVNQLTMLSPNIFSGCTTLSYINLSGNQLTNLPKDIFNEITNVYTGNNRLNFLDLSNNRLSTLPEGVFENTTGLLQIKLGGNQFVTLLPALFNGLRFLQELDLTGNPLSNESRAQLEEALQRRNVNLKF